MAQIYDKINGFLRGDVVRIALRLIVGAIFIYASWEKILKPDDFMQIIQGYHLDPIISLPVAKLVAIWLPWTEMGAGLALIAGIWPRAMGLLFSLLTALFIAALAQALLRGIDIRCGCFDLSPQAATRDWISLWQEVLLLLTCLAVWIGHWTDSHDIISRRSAGETA